MKFDKHLFRCSSLGYLMTNPRSKKEQISKTTVTHLKDIFIGEEYGRYWDIQSKYLDKGNYAEEDSFDLVVKNRGELYVKNKEQFKNDYVSGTPDLVTADLVIDIKTCWDMRSFINKDEVEKNYYWQLQGYMWLTDKTNSELIYTLVNTPEHLIVSEKTKQMYQKGLEDGTPEMAEMEEQVEKWMTFDDVDTKKRMRVFKVERNDADIAKLVDRIIDCREYLNSITLN